VGFPHPIRRGSGAGQASPRSGTESLQGGDRLGHAMDAGPVGSFCLSSRPSHTSMLHDAGTSCPRSQPAGAQIPIARRACVACVIATRPHRTGSAMMQGMQPLPGSQLATLIRCPGRHVLAVSSDLRGTHDDDSMLGRWSCLQSEACVDSTVRQDKGLVARFDSQNSAEWASTGRAASDHWLRWWAACCPAPPI